MNCVILVHAKGNPWPNPIDMYEKESYSQKMKHWFRFDLLLFCSLMVFMNLIFHSLVR